MSRLAKVPVGALNIAPRGAGWMYCRYGVELVLYGATLQLRVPLGTARGTDLVIYEPGLLLRIEEQIGVHLLNRWRRP